MNPFYDFIINNTNMTKPTIIVMFILLFICSYLLGSLNFGVILSRKMANDDIRNHGSGNAGTTNMLRTYGKKYAIMTIIGDMAKVAVAIFVSFLVLFGSNCFNLLFGKYFMDDNVIILKSLFGFFCVLGHIFPCYFEFKGGKGVATCGGMVFMIDYRIALILLLVFITIVLITKMVSIGSLTMAALYPLFMFVFHRNYICLLLSIVFAAIIFVSHRTNIVKIIKGKENKITLKKSNNKI